MKKVTRRAAYPPTGPGSYWLREGHKCILYCKTSNGEKWIGEWGACCFVDDWNLDGTIGNAQHFLDIVGPASEPFPIDEPAVDYDPILLGA